MAGEHCSAEVRLCMHSLQTGAASRGRAGIVPMHSCKRQRCTEHEASIAFLRCAITCAPCKQQLQAGVQGVQELAWELFMRRAQNMKRGW
eukprot:1160099-Pelagomonas_calceolata.AAC.2